MKILVIDDDSGMRYTLARVLSIGGHDVVTAEDGDRGMEAFRRLLPELVITDIFMPEQEGIETIRQIRRERPTAKIMAISGSISGDRSTCWKSPACWGPTMRCKSRSTRRSC